MSVSFQEMPGGIIENVSRGVSDFCENLKTFFTPSTMKRYAVCLAAVGLCSWFFPGMKAEALQSQPQNLLGTGPAAEIGALYLQGLALQPQRFGR
jgi:hypothetical protein